MRLLSADYIFPVSSYPLKNGLLAVNENGTIAEVLAEEDINFPSEGVQKFEGILVPGFINTHCHLELSHLKGAVEPRSGLPKFLKKVVTKRDFSKEDILSACEKAEAEMLKEGIVAVGDISNGSDSFLQKTKGNLRYYTFFELLGFDPSKAEIVYARGTKLLEEYYDLEKQHPSFKAFASLVPHAPYSVSKELFKLIGGFCYEKDGVISVHNQENEQENLLYQSGSGGFIDFLQSLSIDTGHWKATGYNSLPSVLSYLPKCNKILCVHNTFTNADDIIRAQDYSKMMYWCFCPKANLYIEGKLPNVPEFVRQQSKITIGTDSLASNDTLSVLEEIKNLQKYFPELQLEELIKWATLNGAELFGFRDLGSFEKGKKPGVNLIQNLDINNLAFTPESKVLRLL
jgi:aminodeoxyfutalosine deaminase